MSSGDQPKTSRPVQEAVGLILQINRPGDGKPLQFSATIQNLSGGLVTLEVKNPWINLEWEKLAGQKVTLNLVSGDAEQVTDLGATLSWAKFTTRKGDRLNLGLELASPTAMTRKQLTEKISHTTEDIKGLWDRWDEARQSSAAAVAISTKIGYAAVILLGSGMALQLAELQVYRLLGWGLWLLGTLAVAGQTFQYWRARKAAR